ncbi:pentapeptide repeat-containing protein [Paenibacillus sp. GCM10023252]|uniref:pentapeptide repeat-containing protein n=1 Tax=Paenibacillus sp. GCM10023252 TaxID=3252649 RepID=UPI003620B0D4
MSYHQVENISNSRAELRADCESCFGLCCAALQFGAGVDFAADKAAGQACPNLREDFRCGVHTELREIGYRGCTVYDCFGAGQKVSQLTFGGRDWRQAPATSKQMFDVLPVMRQLHELLWYLGEALSLASAQKLIGRELQEAYEQTEHMTELPSDELLQLDVDAHRAEVNRLLLRVSKLVRGETLRPLTGKGGRRKVYDRGADLFGAKLRGADLRGAFLRGACLIAADLRDADLRGADLIGADCRDTDLRGADLSSSLFLTQFQVNAAKGDAATKLPPMLMRPGHWGS